MNHLKKISLIVAVIAIALLAHSLFTRTAKAPGLPVKGDKLNVVASFYPAYFFAREIGGVEAVVTNITPAGAEPHDYTPTPRQMADIERANLLVLSGGVEAWGDRVTTNGIVVRAADGLMTRKEEGEKGSDPHVWLSPVLAERMVVNIMNGYIKADPANATYYRNRAITLSSKLGILNADFKAGLASCGKKGIVTSHAAFGYLADEFGLDQVALAGLSPDQEPSPADLVRIANYARANDVKYIFFEEFVSPKLAKTIASEVGASTLVLDPLEGISDSDMKSGADYFTVMRSNLKNLKTALVCQ